MKAKGYSPVQTAQNEKTPLSKDGGVLCLITSSVITIYIVHHNYQPHNPFSNPIKAVN
jgi:hypothetical protein